MTASWVSDFIAGPRTFFVGMLETQMSTCGSEMVTRLQVVALTQTSSQQRQKDRKKEGKKGRQRKRKKERKKERKKARKKGHLHPNIASIMHICSRESCVLKRSSPV
jgi:hypothetical protein